MAGFWKNKLSVKTLKFHGSNWFTTADYPTKGPTIDFEGMPNLDSSMKAIALASGVRFKSGRGKREVIQTFLGASQTITNGLAVASASSNDVLAATALAAAAATITVGITSPDAARALCIKAAKAGATAVGDGTYATSANSRYVTIKGTDIHDEVMYESIPLNDTTQVNGKKAFKTVTAVYMPKFVNNTSDTVAVGWIDVFGIQFPIESSADIIEFARKASATTTYTIEALGSITGLVVARTLSSGNTDVLGVGSTGVSATQTAFVLDATTSVPAIANTAARQFFRLYDTDGTYEDVAAILWVGGTKTLTVVRGLHGTTARSWPVGTSIVLVQPHTIAPGSATNANDRFRVNYLSYEL